jgi:hypothetical protein
MTDKRQTRSLVREGARTGQDSNCEIVNKHLVMRDSTPTHTDRPTVSRKVTLTLVDCPFIEGLNGVDVCLPSSEDGNRSSV